MRIILQRILSLIALSISAFADENVVTHGAVGNSSTDDSAVFQATMNAACGTTGRVYVPAGSYWIKTAALVPTCDLVFYGDGGVEPTDVPGYTPTGATSTVTFFGLGVQTSYNLRFEHIRLAGNFNNAIGINLQGAGKSLALKNVMITGFIYPVNATTSASVGAVNVDMTGIYPVGTNSVGFNIQNANNVTVNETLISGGLSPNGPTKNALNLRNVKTVDVTFSSFDNIAAGSAIVVQTGLVSGCPYNPTPYNWAITSNQFTQSLSSVTAIASCGNTVAALELTKNNTTYMTDSYIGNYGSVLVQAACGSNINSVYSNSNSFDHLAMSAMAITSTSSGGCASGTRPGVIDKFTSTNDVVANFSTAYPNVLPAINSNNGSITPPTGTPTSYMVHALISDLALSGGTTVLNLASFWDVTSQANVAVPTLTPSGGTYASPQNVTISTGTAGASIRYTTNGSIPSSTAGTLYTTPITISASQTLKAIAYKSGMTDSPVASAAYVIAVPPVITSIAPTSGVAGTQVTISGSGFGAIRGSGAVWLGSTQGIVTSWSDTQIVATIASNSKSGTARVGQSGIWSNALSLDIADVTVSSVTPDNGLPGTSVTIAGSGFGSTQGSGTLLLGTAPGIVQTWSDTQIVALVAAGSTSGSVQVLQGGRTSNLLSFSVTIPQISDVSPASGIGGTTVTITGSGFGSLQGSGTVVLGSKNAQVLTWTDTEIVAVVANDAKSGIARVHQNSFLSNSRKFSVPNGVGAIMTLAPDILNMAIGETRAIQALDSDGHVLTGLTWTSSDPNVVSLSTADPPVLTALAAGHVTITAGSASADVTVWAGDLPLGTVLWSNTLGGGDVYEIKPAVPSPNSMADAFAIAGNGIHALRDDGTITWTTEYTNVNEVYPDFDGGLIKFGVEGSNMFISKIDGATGQLIATYTTADSISGLSVHPDGTVFFLRGCDTCGDGHVAAVDSLTGALKFSEPIIPDQPADSWRHSFGAPIIAGDGKAYVPYIIAESVRINSIKPVSLGILRVTSSGAVDRIPVHVWNETEFGGEGGGYPVNIIASGDDGVLVTWLGHQGECGLAVISSTSVSVAEGPIFPGHCSGDLFPVLQAQDGSFFGSASSEDYETWSMIAFDSTGNVRWIVPDETPVLATADGGVIGISGIKYDQNGSAVGYTTKATQSWRGNTYQVGSVERLGSPATLLAQTLWAQVGGNPSGNNAAARPWYFILNFQNDFNFIPDFPTSLPGLTVNLTSDQTSTIKTAAVAAFKKAYEQWPVIVSEGVPNTGDVRVEVDQVFSGLPSCGNTNDNHTPHNQSYVYYDCAMKNAQLALLVSITNVQERDLALSQRSLIQAIGRGVGSHAAHEAAHLFLVRCCGMDANITSDPAAAGTYNHDSADGDPRPQYTNSDPAPYTGFWKDGVTAIHWQNVTQQKLQQCLGKGWRNYGLQTCASFLGF